MTENGEKSNSLLDELRINKDLKRIAKDIVFNYNCSLEDRYAGLMILIDDINIQIGKLEHGKKRMNMFLNSLFELALKKHKQRRVIEFTEKWGGKEVCEQMAEEMRQIEKPNHCYSFQGIRVIEEDCNLCKRRSCEKLEQDSPSQGIEEILKEFEEPRTLEVIPEEREVDEDGTDE